MEAWDSSRIPRMGVIGRPLLRSMPVEARLTLSCRYIYVIFFGPKGHFVMNKYLYYWTWNLVIILLLYVWFEHLGHTYRGFVPSFSERGMTWSLMLGSWVFMLWEKLWPLNESSTKKSSKPNSHKNQTHEKHGSEVDVGCGPIFSMNMTMGLKITCETLTNSPAIPLLPMYQISTLWIFATPHTCARSHRPRSSLQSTNS
jgi:hypothetical protein